MQKKRTIRICGLSIFCLFFIGICLMPLAMFAATQATVVSEGIVIYKAPDIYVPPTDAEIEESNNTLAGGGFTVETTEDGKGVIRQGISFGGVKGPEIVAAHNSLVGKDENGNAINGDMYKRPFENYVINVPVKLKKGNNVIKLVTNNRNDHGGTFNAETPLIDCIYVCTDKEVAWTEGKCHPENVGQTMDDVKY